MSQQQVALQTTITRLRDSRRNADCISLAAEALGLVESVNDIYIIIGIVRPRFPENDPAIVPLLASARTKRNALVPINKLPPELLINIFRFAASEKKLDPKTKAISDPDHVGHLVRLSAVCCLWKDIVNASPGLWSFLSADLTSPMALQMAIKKSQDVPVTISLGRNSMDTRTFFDLVSPVIHRCRVLCLRTHWLFRTHGQGNKLNDLIRQPSSLLEELYLDAEVGSRNARHTGVINEGGQTLGPSQEAAGIWALQNRPENLKVLSLQYLDWSWNQTTFPSLQDLRLSLVTISVTELLGCLDRTPQLRSLKVYRLNEPRRRVNQAPAQTVTLPFLTRIQIDDVPPLSTHQILSNIIPPSLRQLILSITSFVDPVPFTANSLHYFDLFNSLATANIINSATISIQSSTQQFVAQNVERSRVVKLNAVALRTLRERGTFARWLSGLWKHVEVPTPMALLLGRVVADERNMTELNIEIIRPYMTLDNVTELRIGSEVFRIHILLSRLCIPVLSEENVARWVFPRLQALEVLGQPEAMGWLIRMLEARNKAIKDWEAAGLVDGTGKAKAVPPPAPLQVLKIVRSERGHGEGERADSDRLRQLIGDALLIEDTDPKM